MTQLSGKLACDSNANTLSMLSRLEHRDRPSVKSIIFANRRSCGGRLFRMPIACKTASTILVAPAGSTKGICWATLALFSSVMGTSSQIDLTYYERNQDRLVLAITH